LYLVKTLCWKGTDHFKLGYSPEEIAGTLKLIDPSITTLQVSHESIDTANHAMTRGELRKELVGWLRHGNAKRGPKARG